MMSLPDPTPPTGARNVDTDHDLSPLRRMIRRDYERDLHNLSTASLMERAESARWQLVEMLDDLERDPTSWDYPDENGTLGWMRYKVVEAERELARREALRQHADAPSWRPANPQRIERARERAQRIKDRCPIDCYCIMAGIPLAGGGNTLKGRCPFPDHDDAEPSFVVWIDSGRWHCFSACGRGGDIIDLHGELTGLIGFGETVADLERFLNIEPPAAPLPYATPTNNSSRSRPPSEPGREESFRGVQIIGGKVVPR